MNNDITQKVKEILDKERSLSNYISSIYSELHFHMADIPSEMNAGNIPSTISTMHTYCDANTISRINGTMVSADDLNIVKDGHFTRSYIFANTALSSISDNVPLSDITRLYAGSFFNCKNLSSDIVLKLSGTTDSIGQNCFEYCNNKGFTSAYFPYVTFIDKYAFLNCTYLSSCYFPLVTSIADHAFSGCGFTHIDNSIFPNLTNIGNQVVFRSNNQLTSIDLTALKSIGSAGFTECTALVSVNLPNVERFNTANVFYHCKSLISAEFPSLTGIGIPTSAERKEKKLVDTGNNFSNCYNLMYFSAPELTEMHGSCNFASGDEKTSELISVYMPKLVTLEKYLNGDGSEVSAADRTFDNCKKLQYVYMPECTAIGDYTFRDCLSLLSVRLDSVTALSNNMFINAGIVHNYTVSVYVNEDTQIENELKSDEKFKFIVE